MTQLRDARLRKALDAAPDAQLQPHERTREAILAAAHGAVQPAWRRWWTRAGANPMPWTAALATVVLATLVTVTWQGQDVPGARVETPTTIAPAPGPVPAPEPAPAPGLEPAPSVAPAEAPAPASAPAPVAQAPRAEPPPAAATRPAPMAVPQRPAADALAKAAPAREESRAREAAPAAGASADATLAPAAPLAPAPSPVPAAPPAPAAAAAPAPPAPLPAPAAQRQAAPAFRAALPALPWTQVRIEADGQSVVVARPQAGQLPALVTSLLASTSDDAVPGPGSGLRLELAQGDDALGVLEEVGDSWRWTPMRDAGPPRLLRADPAVSVSLRSEARRLLRR